LLINHIATINRKVYFYLTIITDPHPDNPRIVSTPATLPVISKPMMERIIDGTCLYFGISEQALMQKTTVKDVVYYRKVCWCLIRENCCISYGRIAQRFGFYDHATVLRHVEDMQAQRKIYAQTRHDLEKVLTISNNIDAIINRNENQFM
jgi:hypothetical protein